MNNIEVKLIPYSEAYSFNPYYDEEANLLEVSSSVNKDWPYGFDIDGTVIFDFDKDKVLSNFDVLVPKRQWKSVRSLHSPQYLHKASLQVSEETLACKSFNLTLSITADSSVSQVLIKFGESRNKEKPYALSEKCYALIAEEKYLCGFFLSL